MKTPARRTFALAASVVGLAVAVPLCSPAVAATTTWATSCPSAVGVTSNSIHTGQTLTVGKKITSLDGLYTFGLDGDGTLSLRDVAHNRAQLWYYTAGAGSSLVFSATGDLTLRNSSGAVLSRAFPTSACGELVVDGPAVKEYSTGVQILQLPTGITRTVNGTGAANLEQYPFADTAVWNTGVGVGATFDPTGALATSKTSLLRTGNAGVNSTSWSTAVFQADPSTKYVTDTDINPNDKKNADGTPQTVSVQIPAATVATGGTDGHVAIIQGDGRTVEDFYSLTVLRDANGVVTGATSGWFTSYDLEGDGLHTGARASNVPLMAALIRAGELKNLSIDHAVTLAIPGSMLKAGWIWPASAQDTGSGLLNYAGTIPMGSMVAIAPSVDLDSLGLTPEGLALGRALQNYGGYVLLQAATVAVYVEPAADQQQVANLRTDWSKLLQYTSVVTDSTSTTVAGGGDTVMVDHAPVG